MYSLFFLPKLVIAHVIARLIAKAYINLYEYDIELFTEEGLNLFLTEFITKCNKNFDSEDMINKIEKLLIKKITKRDKKNIILLNNTLSTIYKKYNSRILK